jgi:O-methyltransferase
MKALIRVIREIIIGIIIKLFTKTDIIRYEVLELISAEIYQRNVQGSVAELGVYKGDFAGRINKQFHDRKLFLFDTFEGFDRRDVRKELENGFSSKLITKEGDFTNHSVDVVLRKMKYPENCIIKKGWFPETTKNMNEEFVFVSIDADLFEPIYHGLVFFYPKLKKGGYIFVHDYNGKLYGAKEAVRRFSYEYNIPYVPLNDICGSVVFSK